MEAMRTTKTIEAYRRRVVQIRRQAATHLGYENPRLVPPLSLVEHLIDRKLASEELVAAKGHKGRPDKEARALADRAITRATWRQYKAALQYVLEEERQSATDGVVVEELTIASAALQNESQSGCLKGSRRSSGNKQKAFPDADFEAIESFLKQAIDTRRPHKKAMALLTWLRAGRIVGVRPSEWRSAGLIEVDGRRAIRFGNAKTTNGRGNGASRTLMLDSATDKDIEHLDDMLYMLVQQDKEEDYDFDRELKLLSTFMWRVTRRCLGKRTRYPTLYSLRHQFAADAKLSQTQAEIAALMGHASDATATVHYGRRAAGQKSLKVSALATQVDTVRKSHKSRSHRLWRVMDRS